MVLAEFALSEYSCMYDVFEMSPFFILCVMYIILSIVHRRHGIRLTDDSVFSTDLRGWTMFATVYIVKCLFLIVSLIGIYVWLIDYSNS